MTDPELYIRFQLMQEKLNLFPENGLRKLNGPAAAANMGASHWMAQMQSQGRCFVGRVRLGLFKNQMHESRSWQGDGGHVIFAPIFLLWRFYGYCRCFLRRFLISSLRPRNILPVRTFLTLPSDWECLTEAKVFPTCVSRVYDSQTQRGEASHYGV